MRNALTQGGSAIASKPWGAGRPGMGAAGWVLAGPVASSAARRRCPRQSGPFGVRRGARQRPPRCLRASRRRCHLPGLRGGGSPPGRARREAERTASRALRVRVLFPRAASLGHPQELGGGPKLRGLRMSDRGARRGWGRPHTGGGAGTPRDFLQVHVRPRPARVGADSQTPGRSPGERGAGHNGAGAGGAGRAPPQPGPECGAGGAREEARPVHANGRRPRHE